MGNENALCEEKGILPWIVGFKNFNRYLFGLHVITQAVFFFFKKILRRNLSLQKPESGRI